MENVGADMFMLNNKLHPWIVDYHRKFSFVKLMDGVSADSLIKLWKW